MWSCETGAFALSSSKHTRVVSRWLSKANLVNVKLLGPSLVQDDVTTLSLTHSAERRITALKPQIGAVVIA